MKSTQLAQHNKVAASKENAGMEHACTRLQVHGILNMDDVLTRERLVCQQVLHELGLDVQLLNCLICIDVA